VTEYNRLPRDKINYIFDEEDRAYIRKILSTLEFKFDGLHEDLEKELGGFTI
jgi:predicted house-cleaning noncanonical NTP pyrophosphatase (MazG superfamily)